MSLSSLSACDQQYLIPMCSLTSGMAASICVTQLQSVCRQISKGSLKCHILDTGEKGFGYMVSVFTVFQDSCAIVVT